MSVPRACITLTTDYGEQDGYVGALKGAILQVHPAAHIVDITHAIPPQDIRTGAFVLCTVYAAFPKHTIHVAVVDPEVGTPRALVAARLGHWTFVAPDNGLLSLVGLREPLRQAVELRNRRYARPTISATFHGRDILAPAAAHLARGLALERLGPALRSLRTLTWPAVRRDAQGRLHGRIIHSDRFGNLITNLTLPPSPRRTAWSVRYRHRVWPVRTAYAEVPDDAILALVGGSGVVELARRNGSAHAALHARIGDPVVVIPPSGAASGRRAGRRL